MLTYPIQALEHLSLRRLHLEDKAATVIPKKAIPRTRAPLR
jgi:hypothetical protein